MWTCRRRMKFCINYNQSKVILNKYVEVTGINEINYERIYENHNFVESGSGKSLHKPSFDRTVFCIIKAITANLYSFSSTFELRQDFCHKYRKFFVQLNQYPKPATSMRLVHHKWLSHFWYHSLCSKEIND